jgi:hypothetical protein
MALNTGNRLWTYIGNLRQSLRESDCISQYQLYFYQIHEAGTVRLPEMKMLDDIFF